MLDRLAGVAAGLLALSALFAPLAGADAGGAPIATLAGAGGVRPPLAIAIQGEAPSLGHLERLDENLAEARALGFTHVRVSAHWDQLTREPDADLRPDFAAASPD